MTRQQPLASRTLVGAIAAGDLVPAVLTGGPVLTIGDPLVLNRTGNTAEICKVESIQDSTHVILLKVANNHAANETVESGLLIEQTVRLPKNRSIATVSKGPIASVFSMMGRISYSRRGDPPGLMQEYAMLQATTAFGGAPSWQDIVVQPSDIEKNTNQIWCPIGILMVPYSEVKVAYIGGYIAAALPFQVKQACANVIIAIGESPASPNMKSFKAGDTQMTRFLDSVIDNDTRTLLAPYVSKLYG